MTRLEANRNMVLSDLGWLGRYTYDELPITDQLYVNEQVDKMMTVQNGARLLQESLNVLRCSCCPCCNYPNCGHDH